MGERFIAAKADSAELKAQKDRIEFKYYERSVKARERNDHNYKLQSFMETLGKIASMQGVDENTKADCNSKIRELITLFKK